MACTKILGEIEDSAEDSKTFILFRHLCGWKKSSVVSVDMRVCFKLKSVLIPKIYPLSRDHDGQRLKKASPSHPSKYLNPLKGVRGD